MLTKINFHHLYYFWVIAQEGSIAKACQVLRLAQPTLSSQLKSLENQLGHKLFERKNRSLQLTSIGKISFDYANQIFGLAKEFDARLRAPSNIEPSHIKIGVLPSIPKFTLHDLLRPLMIKKKIFASIVEGSLSYLLRELHHHNLDIVISDHPANSLSQKQFISNKLSEINISFVGHPKFSYLKKSFPSSLNAAPMLLLSPKSQIRAEIDHYFKLHNVTPLLMGEIEDIALLRLFAVSGVALVPLPQNATKEDIKSKSLIKLGQLKSTESALWAITAKRVKPTPLINKLLDDFMHKHSK